jgi:alpha-L-rhamnosidase
MAFYLIPLLLSFILNGLLTSQEPLLNFNACNLKCEYTINPIAVDHPNPRFTWEINNNGCQNSFIILLSKDSASLSSSPEFTNSQVSSRHHFEYNGPPLEPLTKYYWGVIIEDCTGNTSQISNSYFETGLINQDNWLGDWITDENNLKHKPAALFLKRFTTDDEIISAKCLIASLGLHSIELNDSSINQGFLNPIFTDFSKRVFYNTYDITSQMNKGENKIEVILGNGWYNHQPATAWNFDTAPWRGRPKFIMNIIIKYANGNEIVIATDNTWKFIDSQIEYNHIYVGESFDQSKVKNDTIATEIWREAIKIDQPDIQIQSQNLPSITKKSIGEPITFTESNKTNFFMKFAKNTAGIVAINMPLVNQKTHLNLIYSENRNGNHADNTNFTQHYNSAEETGPYQTDLVNLTSGSVNYSPLFSYKGFQYLEIVSDAPINLNSEHVEAFSTYSNLDKIGHFESSNVLLNNIYDAAMNSYSTNMVGYPTDCPHREKNGWTGDGHLTVEIGLFNYNSITTYEKWMQDHQDAQLSSGNLPDIIPTSGWHANGQFDWTVSAILIPWNVYLFTGTERIIKENYEMMEDFMQYWQSQSKNYLISGGYGDWQEPQIKSSKTLISSLRYFQAAQYMTKMSKVVNNSACEVKYENLANDIKKSINKTYFKEEEGYYASGTQLEQSLPLELGIVTDEHVSTVTAQLLKSIENEGIALKSGVLGAKSIPITLSMFDLEEVAFQLASRTEKPSWGYWIKNGATTLREGWGLEGSGNHAYFGTISTWFFRVLGGINPLDDYPGFERLALRPFIPKDLDFVNTAHNSPVGLIISNWKKNGSKVEHEIQIPGSSTGYYQVPKAYNYNQVLSSNSNDSYRPFMINKGLFQFGGGHYVLELFSKDTTINQLNILFDGYNIDTYPEKLQHDTNNVNIKLTLEKDSNDSVIYEIVYQYPEELSTFSIDGDILSLSHQQLPDTDSLYQVIIGATKNDKYVEEYFNVYRDEYYDSLFLLVNMNPPFSFPNPTQDVLFVNLKDNICEDLVYDVFDLSGKKFFCPMNLSVDNQLELNVSSLEQGFYILKISIDKKVESLKFYKEH